MIKMYKCLGCVLIFFVFAVSSESIYSIIAPGIVKSNHKYMVAVSLHEAAEPATIKLRIEGPAIHAEYDAYLQPHQTTAVVFILPKLVKGEHKLIAEGISGIQFRNESIIYAYPDAGPKIYIQTDKAVYKPGDEVQFRVIILDEHTKPLKLEEPIRVDIKDGNGNRVKQFKDIKLKMGVYKDKFQLSEYPVLGKWAIRVYISGKYDYSASKTIKVQPYVLPKFSVYIKGDDAFNPEDRVFKSLIYGKYTFDKYVEGNVTVQLLDSDNRSVIQKKQLYIKNTLPIEFYFDKPEDLKSVYVMILQANITEKYTGLQHSESMSVLISRERYRLIGDIDSIKYRDGIPYRLKATVEHWNGTKVVDRSAPVVMTHGSKEYSAYLDNNGEAAFEFDHEPNANHVFRFKDSTYTLPNIFEDKSHDRNRTRSYCRLRLLTVDPRLGVPLEIEVSSIESIPYIVYTVVSHANIIHVDGIMLQPNQKSYTITITPSIEMIPLTYIYVHYVLHGNYYYDEIEVRFPLEFENKITVLAPQQVKPGTNVTLELKAQPKSYVGVLAVDLGVYLLDSSYDLKRWEILRELAADKTITPLLALEYPGLLSGLVTFTNAHYKFVPFDKYSLSSPNTFGTLKFRKKFPETWIFENYEITNDSTNLTLTIPDTITTWRITAFSVNERTGFGIVDGPTDVTTIQPFFINLNLPYSVKHGEIIAIPILVHNYHDKDVEAEITMYNSEQEFYFMDIMSSANKTTSDDRERKQHVLVSANNVEYVTFLINPRKVGDIELKIVAKSDLTSDAVIQKLKVEPQGVKKRQTKSVYLNVKPEEDYKITLPVNIPEDRVPDSEFVTLSVGGEVLVPTIKNLNNLVLLPTGCGEQNMVNFAPNILVLQYLKAVGKYFTERYLVRKAKKFIEVGYQQQLSFRHKNGGFSVFGEKNDAEPSAWLTAYVLRCFLMGSNNFALEDNIIEEGLEYLSQIQHDDGSFPQTGYLFYPAQQNRYGFTAFIMMTFLEDKTYAEKYQNIIQKSLKYLNMDLHRITDAYALAIMAVAFQMAKHANAEKVMEKLKASRQENADFIWYSQNDGNPEKDVEITAYALMALLQENGSPDDHMRMVKWLTEQRNERGGFKSSHDTVVGLQALVKYSEKYGGVDNLNVTVKYTEKNNVGKDIKSGQLTVNTENLFVLQTDELSPKTRSIAIEASGMGNSLLQLSYHYNVQNEESFKYFLIEPQAKMLNSQDLLLPICVTYKPAPESSTDDSITNMIIVETNLPSGFVSSEELRADLLENGIVERVESRNDETTVVIYLKKIARDVKHCVEILSYKSYDVDARKPQAIVVYDYYNVQRHNTVFYEV